MVVIMTIAETFISNNYITGLNLFGKIRIHRGHTVNSEFSEALLICLIRVFPEGLQMLHGTYLPVCIHKPFKAPSLSPQNTAHNISLRVPADIFSFSNIRSHFFVYTSGIQYLKDKLRIGYELFYNTV